MIGVMNDSKWNELRLAMYELGPQSPKWRTRDKENGYTCPWEGEWFYHFRNGGYSTIEWVELRIDSPAQREAVLAVLRKVHVPGEETELGFRVWGWVPLGAQIDYIK